MSDVIEGNKLIAEFMGGHKYGKTNMWTISNHGSIHVNDFKYHTDWNWLMPACLKFDNLDLDSDEYFKWCDEIDAAVCCYKILPVFEIFVEAIKWYNQNKNKTNLKYV